MNFYIITMNLKKANGVSPIIGILLIVIITILIASILALFAFGLGDSLENTDSSFTSGGVEITGTGSVVKLTSLSSIETGSSREILVNGRSQGIQLNEAGKTVELTNLEKGDTVQVKVGENIVKEYKVEENVKGENGFVVASDENEYIVDGSLNKSYPEAQTYKTLQEASNAAGDNATILVKDAGTYTESVSISNDFNITSYSSNSKPTFKIPYGNVGIKINGDASPTITDLAFRNSEGMDRAVDASGTSGDWTINNVEFTNNEMTTGAGRKSMFLLTDTTGSWEITNSEITGNDEYGYSGKPASVYIIDVRNSNSDWNLKNNVINNCCGFQVAFEVVGTPGRIDYAIENYWGGVPSPSYVSGDVSMTRYCLDSSCNSYSGGAINLDTSTNYDSVMKALWESSSSETVQIEASSLGQIKPAPEVGNTNIDGNNVKVNTVSISGGYSGTIKNVDGDYLRAGGSTGDWTIQNSEFSGNAYVGSGIVMDLSGSSGNWVLDNVESNSNTISLSSNTYVLDASNSDGDWLIKDSEFRNNEEAGFDPDNNIDSIVSAESTTGNWEIKNTDISNNQDRYYKLDASGSSNVGNATENWWGTTDNSSIESNINGEVGVEFKYKPYCTSSDCSTLSSE